MHINEAVLTDHVFDFTSIGLQCRKWKQFRCPLVLLQTFIDLPFVKEARVEPRNPVFIHKAGFCFPQSGGFFRFAVRQSVVNDVGKGDCGLLPAVFPENESLHCTFFPIYLVRSEQIAVASCREIHRQKLRKNKDLPLTGSSCDFVKPAVKIPIKGPI